MRIIALGFLLAAAACSSDYKGAVPTDSGAGKGGAGAPTSSTAPLVGGMGNAPGSATTPNNNVLPSSAEANAIPSPSGPTGPTMPTGPSGPTGGTGKH